MRLGIVALAWFAATLHVIPATQQGWHALPHEAKRKSVAAGDAALLQACAPEIAVIVADARRSGATVDDSKLAAAISESITNWWWAEGATDGIREEYKNTDRRARDGESGYAFTQCAIAAIDAWKAGVREPAQLRAKWRPFPRGDSAVDGATPASPGVSAARAAAVPDDGNDAPVDCVQLNDTPGSFKNTCDFDVYFTYCGVNPARDSWVAECSKQSFGLIDIAARGVQGGFTRAEKLYFFECRSPRTPKGVEFREGQGLYGSCR